VKPGRKTVAVANFILLPHACPRFVTLPGGRGTLSQGSQVHDPLSGPVCDRGIERTSLRGD